MAIEHKDITEDNLHEVKGASTASAGQVLESDGLGSAEFVTRLTKYTATLSPAIVAANVSAEQTFTVTGLVDSTDMIVSVEKPTSQAGLGIVGWRVSADNQIGITFMNTTASGITPTASEVYQILAYRA